MLCGGPPRSSPDIAELKFDRAENPKDKPQSSSGDADMRGISPAGSWTRHWDPSSEVSIRSLAKK